MVHPGQRLAHIEAEYKFMITVTLTPVGDPAYNIVGRVPHAAPI